MDCSECGQNVGLAERHTFTDCAMHLARHRSLLDERYALELVARIEELEAEVARMRPLASWGEAYMECGDCREADGEMCREHEAEFQWVLAVLGVKG